MTATVVHGPRRRVLHWRRRHRHHTLILSLATGIILLALLSYWVGIGACAAS